VSQLVRNTGEVFTALSERQGQLQGLIRNSGAVFATTARRNQDLRETFIALPTFLDESRLTLNRLDSFARNADPVITQLHPAARALSADLKPLAKVAPHFKSFFVGLRKTERRAVAGLPALQRLLDTTLPPLLTEIVPFARQLNPIVAMIGRYQRDITGLLGNVTGATQATANTEANELSHYIRSSAPLYPESLAAFTDHGAVPAGHRLTYSRTNPYPAPGSALDVASAMLTFDTRPCASPPGVEAVLAPDATYTGNPDFADRATFDTPEQILDFIKEFPFRDEPGTAGLARPPCNKQLAQPSLGQVSEATDYPHVYANP
jgi:phospholipid/cholesterol/gamma-HCH transport system substrate-binding protein